MIATIYCWNNGASVCPESAEPEDVRDLFFRFGAPDRIELRDNEKGHRYIFRPQMVEVGTPETTG